MPRTDVHAVFIQRLKQARKALGLSQAALGREIGLPEETASTRINRYERGVSEPDLRTAEALAQALGVSLSWLVCTDPQLATLIDAYSKMSPDGRHALIRIVELTATGGVRALVDPPVKRRATKKVAVGGRTQTKTAKRPVPKGQ